LSVLDEEGRRNCPSASWAALSIEAQFFMGDGRAKPSARDRPVFGRSEVHRNEEAIHRGLATTDIVTVENPIVSILTWKRNLDRYLAIIAVHSIVFVGDSMDLLRSEVMSIGHAATGFLHPGRDGLSICPNVMCLALTARQNKRNNREFGSHFGVLRS
jgi:hypothetical protein